MSSEPELPAHNDDNKGALLVLLGLGLVSKALCLLKYDVNLGIKSHLTHKGTLYVKGWLYVCIARQDIQTVVAKCIAAVSFKLPMH